MVDSDSIVALTRYINKKFRPWKYWHIFASIDEIKMSIHEELFRKSGRDTNGMADSLARSECFRSQMFFVCCSCNNHNQ
ncbi:hypothetical protein ERO13_D05G352176v2 [Gossypium hirsutum]|nr:hypothetical protein ERO13_D05G352176v2 [Gossypium hirsutum]